MGMLPAGLPFGPWSLLHAHCAWAGLSKVPTAGHDLSSTIKVEGNLFANNGTSLCLVALEICCQWLMWHSHSCLVQFTVCLV